VPPILLKWSKPVGVERVNLCESTGRTGSLAWKVSCLIEAGLGRFSPGLGPGFFDLDFF